jgi:hypothetical protein
MQTQSIVLTANIPSVDDFARHYPNLGPHARNKWNFIFDLLMSPDCYHKARVATLDLELPAVAGVAATCYQAVQGQQEVGWDDNLKRFIGAVVCNLMEANGFEKTGKKKAIPHPAFTKGEFYRLASSS